MKTLFITNILILITSSLFATELSWVDEQVEAIKPPRKSSKINYIRTPFVFLEKNGYLKQKAIVEKRVISTTNSKGQKVKKVIVKKHKPGTFVLDAILNNSALINGNWYKKNERINSYTIVDIDKSTVVLKNIDRKITLSTNIKRKTLKFKNK